jgi:spore germination protein GerM
MLSRKSQIEHTLKEFSTVESVEISVNGETENILQP